MAQFLKSLAFDPIPIVDLSGLHSGIVMTDALPENTEDNTYVSFSEEPLADLFSYGISGQKFYARSDGDNFPYNRRIEGAIDGLYARVSVAKLLQRANEFLSDFDIELYVFDAYRSIPCQHGLWDFFSEAYCREHPNASQNDIDTFTRTYVSDPRSFSLNDPTTHPLHSTGGAIDLTLRRRSSGELFDMGTHFDNADEASHTHFFEQELHAGRIAGNDPRLLSRRILYGVMTRIGFTNYPYEFWHYDYGNRMHALMLKRQGEPHPTVQFAYIPFERNSIVSS